MYNCNPLLKHISIPNIHSLFSQNFYLLFINLLGQIYSHPKPPFFLDNISVKTYEYEPTHGMPQRTNTIPVHQYGSRTKKSNLDWNNYYVTKNPSVLQGTYEHSSKYLGDT